jgi:hypothetical protein
VTRRLLRRPGVPQVPLVRRIVRGRRLSDPIEGPVPPGILAVRGRLAGVSVSASMGAGAWVGFALGLVAGAVIGGALSWFAGALLDWQRDLAFTFGVARRLLPFGDQLPLLRGLESNWFLVVPVAALAVGLLAATVGALLGGILAAAYNRSPRHALVVVELPSEVPDPTVAGLVPTPADPVDAGPAHPGGRPEPAIARATLRDHGNDREE